jgi:hypothetical protein
MVANPFWPQGDTEISKYLFKGGKNVSKCWGLPFRTTAEYSDRKGGREVP